MNSSPQSRLRRSVAALLLLLAFLALPAGAAPRDWSLFSSSWSLLSALWEELGSLVDPSGQAAANPGSQDYGAVVDPDGQPNH